MKADLSITGNESKLCYVTHNQFHAFKKILPYITAVLPSPNVL